MYITVVERTLIDNMPKVSIIIPVYKVEKYIRECLDSIVSQTFTDWECILIDDGSPDKSGESVMSTHQRTIVVEYSILIMEGLVVQET